MGLIPQPPPPRDARLEVHLAHLDARHREVDLILRPSRRAAAHAALQALRRRIVRRSARRCVAIATMVASGCCYVEPIAVGASLQAGMITAEEYECEIQRIECECESLCPEPASSPASADGAGRCSPVR